MTGTPQPTPVAAEAAGHAPRTWQVHSLPAPGEREMAALLDIAPAWFAGRDWRPHEQCDAALVWEYALRHGLDGMIGRLCLDGRCGVPNLRERATHRYLSNAVRHEQRMAACRALAKAAQAQQTPICILKGPALIHQAYGESGIRAYNDVDVFVESRAQAMALLEAMSCDQIREKDGRGLLNRLSNPCKVSARWRGCELEVCYAPKTDCDPMLEVLWRNRERVLRIPASDDDLPWPEPAAHLLFLIQHMAVNHWFSRLIWYVDLAALTRRAGASLDMDLVQRQIDAMQMRNLACVAGEFSRRQVGIPFPAIAAGPSGWRRNLIKVLSSRDAVVMQRYTHDRQSKGLHLFFLVMYVAQLVVYTDARRGQFFHGSCRPANRMIRATRIRSALAEPLLRLLFLAILVPVLAAAWVMSWAMPSSGECDGSLLSE